MIKATTVKEEEVSVEKTLEEELEEIRAMKMIEEATIKNIRDEDFLIVKTREGMLRHPGAKDPLPAYEVHMKILRESKSARMLVPAFLMVNPEIKLTHPVIPIGTKLPYYACLGGYSQDYYDASLKSKKEAVSVMLSCLQTITSELHIEEEDGNFY